MTSLTLNLASDIISDDDIYFEDIEEDLEECSFYQNNIEESEWSASILDTIVELEDLHLKTLQNALYFLNNSDCSHLTFAFDKAPNISIVIELTCSNLFNENNRKWDKDISFTHLEKRLSPNNLEYVHTHIVKSANNFNVWFEFVFRGASDIDYKKVETQFIPKGEVLLLLRKAKIDNLLNDH